MVWTPPMFRFFSTPRPPSRTRAPVSLVVDCVVPPMVISPPIFKFFSIPTPPSTIRAPVSLLVDCVVFVISWVLLTLRAPLIATVSFIFSSLLKVTGPSNCERTCWELPPSTIILSFTITSSKTTDSLEGSWPVIVGTGISKVICSPDCAEYLVLPMKKSPSLFIPV